MRNSRLERMKLAEKVAADLPLTPTEYLQFVGILEGAVQREDPALDGMKLIPWPDPEELGDLAKRARARHDKKV